MNNKIKCLFLPKEAFFVFVLLWNISFPQIYPEKAKNLAAKALELYNAKKYKESAMTFSEAFKLNGWKGSSEDRYNAGCSWALAGYPDSAFFQLNRITSKGMFDDHKRVTQDPDLNSLHKDPRWQPLLDSIQKNRDKARSTLNIPLAEALEKVLDTDQKYRLKVEEYSEKYGHDSKQMQALWDTINTQDALNLRIVTGILDKYGWLGDKEVGSDGNLALFLVIQHSDQEVQEKYLPMMRDAVKKGNAEPSSLALLEDRVALAQGKKQIYGSQLGMNPDGSYYLSPIEDEEHVNERRAAVGLQPIEEYLQHWNMDYIPGMSNNRPGFWRRNKELIFLLIVLCSIITISLFLIRKKEKDSSAA